MATNPNYINYTNFLTPNRLTVNDTNNQNSALFQMQSPVPNPSCSQWERCDTNMTPVSGFHCYPTSVNTSFFPQTQINTTSNVNPIMRMPCPQWQPCNDIMSPVMKMPSRKLHPCDANMNPVMKIPCPQWQPCDANMYPAYDARMDPVHCNPQRQYGSFPQIIGLPSVLPQNQPSHARLDFNGHQTQQQPIGLPPKERMMRSGLRRRPRKCACAGVWALDSKRQFEEMQVSSETQPTKFRNYSRTERENYMIWKRNYAEKRKLQKPRPELRRSNSMLSVRSTISRSPITLRDPQDQFSDVMEVESTCN